MLHWNLLPVIWPIHYRH
ncbi:hypothetical protein BLA29_009794 [Euroglyphus maynei]|uniref:Uncharacterized protein n=1 Tax=Euroglyphus maynei TaxID=6958 RepID=A0A1Y3AQ24_EURMA|nr:hypothetical protein BLA29_009794 [Euroglyphus maynei]